MSNHSTLFTSLIKFIGSAGVSFHDIRIMTTFGWALVGLLISESIHLNQWALFRPGRAKAASKERQLSHWIHNEKIRPMLVYRSLAKQVLEEWAGKAVYVALDTTLLWNRYVIVRLALVYRGRALPLGRVVCASGSATVHLARYQQMLAQVAQIIPPDSYVVLLADRGFKVHLL